MMIMMMMMIIIMMGTMMKMIGYLDKSFHRVYAIDLRCYKNRDAQKGL
jgi:hypothetical protein